MEILDLDGYGIAGIIMNDQWNDETLNRDIEISKFEERMTICKSCDSLNSINLCEHCGCFMPVKTRLSFAKCPADKW
jgi:hypothetical protein